MFLLCEFLLPGERLMSELRKLVFSSAAHAVHAPSPDPFGDSELENR